MRYDFSRKNDWLPLFNQQIHAPVNFKTNKLRYTHKRHVEDLETQLERQLKKKISKQRQLDRTIWNHQISSSFKNIFKSFEINCMYNRNHFETISEMNTVIIRYEVNSQKLLKYVLVVSSRYLL